MKSETNTNMIHDHRNWADPYPTESEFLLFYGWGERFNGGARHMLTWLQEFGLLHYLRIICAWWCFIKFNHRHFLGQQCAMDPLNTEVFREIRRIQK